VTHGCTLPRVNEQQRSAGSRDTGPDLPPVPLIHVRSVPLAVHGPSVCVTGLGQTHGRSATRTPLGVHPPGVAVRSKSRPANRAGKFQEVGLQEPTHVYDPYSVRLQYRA
jgi:hypothetical protein